MFLLISYTPGLSQPTFYPPVPSDRRWAMKKPWLVRLHRGLYYPVSIRDYFINHNIRMPIKQPVWLMESKAGILFRGSGDIAGQYLGYVVGRQLAFRNLSGNEAPRGVTCRAGFSGVDQQKWRGKIPRFQGALNFCGDFVVGCFCFFFGGLFSKKTIPCL